MKQITLITIAILISSLSPAFGQESISITFEKQSQWSPIALRTDSKEASFAGVRTNRGTLRVEFDFPHTTSPFELKIRSKSDELSWKKACGSYSYDEKLKSFSSVKLIVTKNPFSPNYPYYVENLRNEREHTVSLSQIENAPKISNYKVKIEGNDLRTSIDIHVEGYLKYINTIEAELNQQLNSQKKQFDLGMPLELDLSSPEMKIFACDLSLDLIKLSVGVEFKAEVVKVESYNWIEKEELETLYNELQSGQSLKGNIKGYRAGIKVGQAFLKINDRIILSKNDRDFKILDTLFKQEKDSSMYTLKSLTKKELEDKFHELPELIFPKTLKKIFQLQLKCQNLEF